jgi:hypothetical protein
MNIFAVNPTFSEFTTLHTFTLKRMTVALKLTSETNFVQRHDLQLFCGKYLFNIEMNLPSVAVAGKNRVEWHSFVTRV